MAVTPKTWTLEAVAATPDDLVDETATIATLIISNTGSTEAECTVKVGTAVIVPSGVTGKIPAGESKVLDMRSLNVSVALPLNVESDSADVYFVASGVTYA
jgi:hypothetical protein